VNLKTKSSLAIVALLLVLFGIGAVIQNYLIQTSLKQTIADQQFSLITRVADEIDSRFRLQGDALARVAAGITPEVLADPLRLQAYLEDRHGLLSFFDDLVVVSPSLRVLADHPVFPGRRGAEVAHFEHLRQVLETRQPAISPPFLGKVTQRPSLAQAVPVVDGAGRTVAILSGQMNLLDPGFLGSLNERKSGRSGHFVLTTRERVTIVSRFKDRVMRLNVVPGANPVFDQAIAGWEGTQEGTTSYGQRMLMSFRSLRTADWVLGSLLPVEEAYAPIHASRQTALWLMFGASLLVGLIVWLMMRSLFQPLLVLRENVRRLGREPELAATLTAGRDEIGEVAADFYRLCGELLQARHESEGRAEELRTILDASPLAVALIRNRCLLSANRAFERMFGYRVDEVRGQSVEAFYTSAEAFVAFGQRLYPEIANGGVAKFEQEYKDRAGRVFWTNFYARLLDPLQPDKGAVVLIEDISERKATEAAREESEERHRQMFLGNASVMFLVDPERAAIVDANPAACAFYGYPLQAFRGKPLRDIDPRPEGEYRAAAERVLADGRGYFLLQHRMANGEIRHVEVHASPLRVGGQTLIYSIVHDVTQRHRAEEQLRLAAKAIASSGEGIVVTDRDNRIVSVNPAFCALSGYEADELLGRTPELFRSSRHDDAFYRAMWDAVRGTGSWQGEIWNRDRHGRVVPEWLTISVVRDAAGEIEHYVGIFTDISERKRSEERIRHLAEHDALTNLPNRVLLGDRLSQAIVQAQREGRQMALIFLDLDRFKNINDSLGHQIGDQLLQVVAERIHQCVRASDTVSRQGGDEFIMLLPEIAHPSDAARVAEKLLEALAHPCLIEGHELTVTASLGIGIYPDDGADPATLIRNADTAMYHSKESGRNAYHFFRPEMNARVFERMSLENSLRRALERGEFLLHYQPQIDIATRRLIGMEALVRWQHPELGLVPPMRFIPVAEDSGLILGIGAWVLGEACRQNRAWQAAGLPALPVAVNISALQFAQPRFIEAVGQALQASGLAPHCLELELTESVMMQAAERNIEMLETIRRMGVQVAIDDFGTDYSSLAYLKRLPIDKLKIDQAFVRDIVTDADDAAIIAAIIGLAQNLKLRVIAEGVENEAQFDFLRRGGCAEAQGYLFSRPLPGAEFERFWRASLAA